ncbi:MAG: hypothetical protein R6W31_08500 [Bacteroidales bacterium]
MNDFLKRMVEGNGVTPSEVCLKSLNQNFEDAINVEWFKKDNCFEAIFYKNNREHIAIFSSSGILNEYRLNIPPDYLPEIIKNFVSTRGEIMNSVIRNKGNMIEYEVIFRDKELNRHLINLSDIGRIIEEKKL